MDVLIQYGLFLAKTLTLVVAFIVVVAFVAASSQSRKGRGEKGQIAIEKLNHALDDLRHTLACEVLDEKTLKAEEKARKKQEKAAEKAAKGDDQTRKKRVYVMDFNGDIAASASEPLRHMITAVLSLAQPQDEVVVCLESQGGMVHAYGFASSQLARITQKSIPLTVCVDKVAASGGYMMACVANKIIAAPFAIIGSIGVVASLPNFHRVLKKHDVDYEMLTAGEYKRTLTVFGENTDKGRQKFQNDLEDTHALFKDFIHQHRPQVDIQAVATGEIWFGQRALAQQLIDEISTSDQYITALHPEADLYKVTYTTKKTLAEKLGFQSQTFIHAWLSAIAERLGVTYWAK